MRSTWVVGLLLLIVACAGAYAEPPVGYYRQPALSGSTIVFVAEGDLWRVAATGGVATRLTSHPDDESEPAVSPDGRTLAFLGRYEGPRELYTMPLEGGRPTRRTYGADRASVSGWTPDGRVLYSTLLQRQAKLRDADPIEGRGGAGRHLVEQPVHRAQCFPVGRARAQGLELDQELAALGHHGFQIRDVGEIAERPLGRAKGCEALSAVADLRPGQRALVPLHDFLLAATGGRLYWRSLQERRPMPLSETVPGQSLSMKPSLEMICTMLGQPD